MSSEIKELAGVVCEQIGPTLAAQCGLEAPMKPHCSYQLVFPGQLDEESVAMHRVEVCVVAGEYELVSQSLVRFFARADAVYVPVPPSANVEDFAYSLSAFVAGRDHLLAIPQVTWADHLGEVEGCVSVGTNFPVAKLGDSGCGVDVDLLVQTALAVLMSAVDLGEEVRNAFGGGYPMELV